MMPFFKLASFSFMLLVPGVVIRSQAQPPPLKSLGEVLMMVLDTDKDQRVTLAELKSQLGMLETLFQEDEGGEYLKLLKAVQAWSPQLFALLDSNGDQKLSAKELMIVTKFEQSLRKDGKFKPLLRSCFQLFDVNGDDEINAEEWAGAKKHTSQIAIEVHQVFPALRKTPKDLESFVQTTLLGIMEDHDDNAVNKKASELFDYLDENKDGVIQRKEVGAAYNVAGKKFMEISKSIKQMGPMLALFGGGGMGGSGMGNMMNNMKTEF